MAHPGVSITRRFVGVDLGFCVSFRIRRCSPRLKSLKPNMADGTRWAWLPAEGTEKRPRTGRSLVESGWLHKSEFKDFWGEHWEEKWNNAPRDEMPSRDEFRRYYGKEWERHWRWHNESEDEDGKVSESRLGERSKRKRKALVPFSPKVSTPRKKRRKRKLPEKVTSHRKRKAVSMMSEFHAFRQQVRKILAKISYQQQVVQAHLSDVRGASSKGRVLDNTTLELARGTIAWEELSLRRCLLNLVSIHHEYESLPESVFEDDGIDAGDIQCCACNATNCSDSNDILLCDGPCQRAYHQNCLSPPVAPEDIPPGDEDWFCHQCDTLLDCLDMINEQYESFRELPTIDSFGKVCERFFPEHSIVQRCSGSTPHSNRRNEIDPRQAVGLDVARRIKKRLNRIEICGKVRNYDMSTETLHVVFADGEVRDLSLSELNDLCRALPRERIGRHAPGSNGTNPNVAGNTILDLAVDDLGSEDNDSDAYVPPANDEPSSHSSSDESSEDSDDDGESSGCTGGGSNEVAEPSAAATGKSTSSSGASQEADEDDGTRWAWLPHAGSAESGWLTEEQFKDHFGEDWEKKWQEAPQSQMPSEAEFRKFYGEKRWRKHWNWHQNDETLLVVTRSRRERPRLNYEILFQAIKFEGEEGWGSELDQDEEEDPDFE